MAFNKKGPARQIRGIRTSIPAGFVLGRLSSGDGETELISISKLGGALTSTGGGGGGVGSANSVRTLQQQQAGTNSALQGLIANPPSSSGSGALFIQKDVGDETTAITTGTGKKTFRMPTDMTVSEVRASLTTAQASGSIFTVDVKKAGTTIFSTLLTIDNTEKTSTTAAAFAVISNATLLDDAEMRIDVTQVGDGTATGLKVTFVGGSPSAFNTPSLDFSDYRNSQYIGVA